MEGIGFATACKLKASFELGEKAQTNHKKYSQKIDSPEDVFNLLKNKIGNRKQEHFIVLSSDSRSCLIGIDRISIGTIDASLAHPGEIFAIAVKNRAASIILAHNYPSGKTEPSIDNQMKTNEIIRLGDMLGIRVINHIIIAGDKCYSFKEDKFLSFN